MKKDSEPSCIDRLSRRDFLYADGPSASLRGSGPRDKYRNRPPLDSAFQPASDEEKQAQDLDESPYADDHNQNRPSSGQEDSEQSNYQEGG